MSNLRVVFAGTPDFAAMALLKLVEAKYDVVAVYTQPDRPAGRGRKLQASPVKQVAIEHHIPVYQPENFKSAETIEELKSLDADVMIVAAYGLLLPISVLETPRYGCLNIHASILPRWRGAAPIQRAIAAGDKESGISIMQMDKGLDTGDILQIDRCEIADRETGGSLHDKLAKIGANSIVEVLKKLEANQLQPVKQDNELATYAHKLKKAEAEINWNQSVTEINNQVRAFNPWPVSYTRLQGKTIRIWETEIQNSGTNNDPAGTIIDTSKQGIDVQCSDGTLRILKLQPPGSKAMDVTSFMNGHARLLPRGTSFDAINSEKQT